MKHVKLAAHEKDIEESLLKGEYGDVDKETFQKIAETIAARKKDTVLNIRVNSRDLYNIKEKARKLGIKYQTFISELLHRVAHN